MKHPFSGKELKQGGIQVAADNAELKNPGWQDKAIEIMKLYLNDFDKSFLCEHFRRFAEEQCGLEPPPHSRAYGAVMQRAKRDGLIKHAGITQVKNPRAHMANASLWVKAKAEEA